MKILVPVLLSLGAIGSTSLGAASYFAELDQARAVKRVVVIPDEFAATGEAWTNQLLGGTWKQTFIDNSQRGRYAGRGYWYDPIANLFKGPSADQPGCPVVFSSAFTVSQPAAPIRGRVYLFGSLNILSGVAFSDQLNALHIQVVTLATPQIVPCLYRDNAIAYNNAVATAINSVVDQVTAQYGPARSFIGGGSIGGLHAMMGYALVPRFDGWFASVTVTKIGVLTEFSGFPNPDDFDPFFQIDRLKGSTGFITWGTADTRVDFHLSQALYAQIQPIDHIEYVGLDHSTTPQQIDDLVIWISAHI